MRYLSPWILNDLSKKMVFLSGPRQSGKSTLAQSLYPHSEAQYLNWDISKHKKIISNQEWDKNKKLVILDELHKFKNWKNFLKGVYDEYQNKPSLLITGSAKLDTFKKQGDALTGRYFHYRLHPIDLAEALEHFGFKDKQKTLVHLLKTGGFPEAFLHPQDAERIRQDRFDLVLQEDLRDLSKTNSLQGIAHLIEILRDSVGDLINYDSISKQIGYSAPTIKSWLDLLERLYLIFKVSPFSHRLSNSLKKDSKYYFYDCAVSENEGSKLENLVACALLKFCQFIRDTSGRDLKLYFYRDKQKREVDFVIAERTKVGYCIEVKTSEKNFSSSLMYLNHKIKPTQAIQLNLNHSQNLEKDGVMMLAVSHFLANLYKDNIYLKN